MIRALSIAMLFLAAGDSLANATDRVPAFDDLLARPVKLRPELDGRHPRVFVTAEALATLRERARGTHADEWRRALANLRVRKGTPPPPPGPQARRSQNEVAFAIVEAALAYVIERDPKFLAQAKAWMLAAIDYEPWGYTYNKPNVDLAAGHLLYAIGWAYDLLHGDLMEAERTRVRQSLTRHARLVAEHFSPRPGKRFAYSQNHDFIPTAGLAVAALALMGEVPEAPGWAALARAHHHRAGMLLSPDGYYYEGFEYWIFSAPWLVHFLDAWEHATGESLWEHGPARNWARYVAHTLLPDGQNIFDFGDAWEGPLTRARQGAEVARVYPGGTLQSNYNVLYRVAARLRDPEAQAVAERLRGFGHSNLEEVWTLLWRDPALAPASLDKLPLAHHFADSGVVFARTSWGPEATAFAFKAGPPQGHRAATLLGQMPDATLDSGHAHPDAGSFIIFAHGKYLVGDTGYSGRPTAREHNTVVVNGVGQGKEGRHDVWRDMPYDRLAGIKIVEARLAPASVRVRAELAAAYPQEAGLRRFHRTFTFRAPGTFTVEDDLTCEQPSAFEWFLHGDAPFSVDGRRFVTPAGGDGARLEGELARPADAQLTTGETFLLAPGAPGSIEKGKREARGYELRVVTKAPARRARVLVKLKVQR